MDVGRTSVVSAVGSHICNIAMHDVNDGDKDDEDDDNVDVGREEAAKEGWEGRDAAGVDTDDADDEDGGGNMWVATSNCDSM